jgi:hypothetical protein
MGERNRGSHNLTVLEAKGLVDQLEIKWVDGATGCVPTSTVTFIIGIKSQVLEL